MNENTIQQKLIEKRHLENGVTLYCYDASRKIAGDRWYIQLRCEAVIPVKEEFFQKYGEKDENVAPEMKSAIRRMLGDNITFDMIKERHFVDKKDKNDVMAELLGHVMDHMLSYLDKPLFPQRLLDCRYEECKQRCLLEERQRSIEEPDKDDDDDGPADFSSCFVD